MKRFYFLFALPLFLFLSCGEEDPYSDTDDGRTRYTVIGNVPSVAAAMIDRATVFEYNAADERIDSNLISNPTSGTQYVFYPNDKANHLKVKLISKEDTYRWGDTIVLLKEGKNVSITIALGMPQTKYEPMLGD